jgi:hypothetical protein
MVVSWRELLVVLVVAMVLIFMVRVMRRL